MSVLQFGQGAEPAVLLHCTLAHGGAWAGVARHMGDRLSMVAPDLLAHGAGPDADRARDFHDQATERASEHLPDQPSHLIGHSFGATLALRMALDAPGRVRSLTLIEPVFVCAADGPGRAAHDAQFAPLAAAMAVADLAGAARAFLGFWGSEVFDDLPEAQRQYVMDRIWIPEATEPALVDDRAGMLPRLSTLRTPTLLVQGTASPPVIDEINTRLSLDLPNAMRAYVDGAGHMAPITHPGPVSDAILGFLDQV